MAAYVTQTFAVGEEVAVHLPAWLNLQPDRRVLLEKVGDTVVVTFPDEDARNASPNEVS